ncbi:MAG: restriction endonuclease subunit S [Betaproteobacteria bacterium]
MAGEWRDVVLEDVADELTVGYVGPMASEYVDDGIPFLRSLNVEPLRINKNDLKFITPRFHQRIQKSRLAPGDVVIVRTGKPGACSVVPEWLTNANCSDLVIVRCGKELNNHFLAYYVNTAASGHVAAHLVGAVQQHFNVGSARTLRLSLPPLSEQRAIAYILGTLDEKIELNRRMSETLEAMARALFNSWFVDFDPVRAKAEGRDPGLPKPLADLFPARLVDSELGEIPEGWEVGRFGDVVEQLRDQENPLSFPDALYHHLSIPAFDDGQTAKVEIGENIKSLKSRVPPGVILISKLNPEIERVWMVDVRPVDRAVCSTEFLVLRARRPFGRAYVYCIARSPLFRQQIGSLVTGTSKSHQRAPVESILNLAAPMPPSLVVEAFDRVANKLLSRTLECRREVRTLCGLRDSLLPKLISGELRVKRAHSVVGAT